MKTCTRCKEEKDENCFRKRATGKDGLNSSCAKCDCIRTNAWRARNPESIKITKDKGKAKLAVCVKNWREKNKDKIVEYAIRKRESLPDYEIVNRLRASGYPQELINNKDFIEIKRIMIKTKRLCRTLNN